ncbi:MAG TPA: hypothetical protein VNX68_04445 [Nitrosopumilaceae archaeon]|jgi:hypothetical protein|nr:hypothetical protein [Nitrosopumilaceae archaeon]
MPTIKLSETEKEMLNFNFDELTTRAQSAQTKIAGAQNVTDVKTEICNVWGKIRKFVVLAENIPVVGKFITILVQLLDSICPS